MFFLMTRPTIFIIEKIEKNLQINLNSDAEGWERLIKTKQCGNELWTVRTLLINIFNMVLTNLFYKRFWILIFCSLLLLILLSEDLKFNI